MQPEPAASTEVQEYWPVKNKTIALAENHFLVL